MYDNTDKDREAGAGTITVEVFGMKFSKRVSDKYAYSVLMDLIPKQREVRSENIPGNNYH